MLLLRGADQQSAEGGLLGEIADRGAFGGAQALNLLIAVDVVGAKLDITPLRRRDRPG